MADQDSLVIGTISYWCREKHYRHIKNVATDAQKRYNNDPFLKFFNAFGTILEGHIQEGMRELDGLINRQDVNLCSTLAMIHAHRLVENVDKEAVSLLDNKLKTERKAGTEKTLYFAGLFLFLTEKYDKAREYVDRSLKMNPRSADTLALKGWVELLGGDEASVKKSIKFFEDSIDIMKTPDGLFGKVKIRFILNIGFSIFH
jgi:hypothetical protein